MAEQDSIERFRSIRRAPASGDVVHSGGAMRNPLNAYDDDEGPSDEDVARFGDVTRTCPECSNDVYDDTAVCPHCGHAFQAGGRRLPWWVVIAGILALAAMIVVALL